MDSTNYYFMKVGKANRMLPFVEALGGLWYGVPPAAEAAYMDDAIDTNALVSVFAPNALLFFRVTGRRKTLARELEHTQAYRGLQEVRSMYPGDYDSPEDWIEVLCVESNPEEIDRTSIVPFVDSLSVYQGLNRGTFRSFARLNNGNNKRIGEISAMDQHRRSDETPSGCVIRKYFDAIRGDREAQLLFDSLTVPERRSLTLATLNPAQMETAALLVFLDMGMLPLVGVAKGLDVIDIRMTVEHLPKKQRDSLKSKVCDFLREVGVENEAVCDELLRTDVLSIQCKAYGNSSPVNGDLVLRFEPWAEPDRKHSLVLEKITPLPGGLFDGWLSVIEKRLTFSEY